MPSFEKAKLSSKDSLIVGILGVGSVIFVGLIFWIFTNKKNNQWLEQTKKWEITGTVINKQHKIAKREFLLTLRTAPQISQDTCINIRPWEKLFEESRINDTLIKKTGTFDFILKRNGEMRVFTLTQ
ncbi:MAG: hypothetical protein ACTHJT_05030 [Cytophaga sp.]|uniref:hypothetical protein n=1 Tax=Cytophaga sp. TaxID=29535 RepID=UPI003F7D0E30